MKHSSRALRQALIGTSFLCLTCAAFGTHAADVQKEDIGEQKALVDPELEAKQQESARVAAMVKGVEAKFSEAVDAKLSFYAPETFPVLQKELAKLRELYKKYDPNKSKGLFSGVSEKDMRAQTDVVEKHLNHAFDTRRLVDRHLGEALAHMEYLATLDIPAPLRKEHEELKADVQELIAEIEDEGEFKGLVGERTALLDKRQRFEVKVMLATHVEPLTKELNQLDRNRIPKTYAQAKSRIDALAGVIQGKPRASQEIAAAKEEAERQLRVAAVVFSEVEQMRTRQPEDVVIGYRAGVDHIARTAANASFEDLPYEQNTNSVIGAIQSAQEKNVQAAIDEAFARGEEKSRAEHEQALATLHSEFAAKESALQERIRALEEQIAALQGNAEAGTPAATITPPVETPAETTAPESAETPAAP